MTDDLDGIELLSKRFSEAIGNLPKSSSGDYFLNENITGQGGKILRMFEGELEKSPDDKDVQRSMSKHLYHMGYMYYIAIHLIFLPVNRPLQKDHQHMEKEARAFAFNACRYLHRSFSMNPNSSAAFVLADIFRISKFYASALYWYNKVEVASDDADAVIDAKSRRLDLQADGKSSDPVIARNSAFPTQETPGLQLENQVILNTSQSNSGTGKKTGGCGLGVLGIVICLSLMGWSLMRWYAGVTQGYRSEAITLTSSAPKQEISINRPQQIMIPVDTEGAEQSREIVGYRDKSAWTARASSTRRSARDASDGHSINYAPFNALDGVSETAWCPEKGNPDDGIGEWIEVAFPSSRRVAEIGMVVGYTKMHRVFGDVFPINNRVQEALFTFSDGSSISWKFQDDQQMQTFELAKPLTTSSVKITILSVYPSSSIRAGKQQKDRWHDTCISELSFRGSR